MNDIEGLRQRAVRSDLDFHHPKRVSLDMVNVGSSTACLRILRECFSLCSHSYPLPIFQNSERTSFHPFHLFPVLDIHPSSMYCQPHLPQLPLSTLPFCSSLLYHISPASSHQRSWLQHGQVSQAKRSLPNKHMCNVHLADPHLTF